MLLTKVIKLVEYTPGIKTLDNYYKFISMQHYGGVLNNTEFIINQVKCYNNETYDTEIIIKSIDQASFTILSIGDNGYEFNIAKDQIMTTKSCLKFDFKSLHQLYICVKSFKNWLNEQCLLTDDCEYNNLIASDYMISSSDVDIRNSSDNFEEKIKSHSIILCSKSKYFLNLFQSNLNESQTKIIDLEISKEALIPILQYIYTGEMNKKLFIIDNYSIILEIYEKVCEYELNKLKPMLQVFILGYLNAKNLKLLMKSGILLQNDDFSEKAMDFIVNCFRY